MNAIIEKVARAILRKNKPKAVAMVAGKPKSKGLTVIGKRKPVAKAKPKVKVKIKAKPKVVAVTTKPTAGWTEQDKIEEAEMLAMLETDPSKAVPLYTALAAKRKRMAVKIAAEKKKRARLMAISPEEKRVEAEIKKVVTAAIKSLTAKLPSPSPINVNHSEAGIISYLAWLAFQSSLDSKVLFTSKDGILRVVYGAHELPVDFRLLEGTLETLKKYSNASKISKVEPAELHKWLVIAAGNYASEQASKLSSDEYLTMLVNKALKVEIKTVKSDGRTAIFKKVTNALAVTAIEIGFTVDSKRSLWINCSDDPHAASKLDKDYVLPYIKDYIKRSSHGGRLKGGNVADDMYTGIINLIKI